MSDLDCHYRVLELEPGASFQEVEQSFLSDNLADCFTAGAPRLDAEGDVWRVPMLLAYPVIGAVEQTGEVLVSARSKRIISHTPIDKMREATGALYDRDRQEIEAIIL